MYHRQPIVTVHNLFWGSINYSYSFGRSKLINVTVTTPGGIARELLNHRNRLQLQLFTSVELISHCSLQKWGPFVFLVIIFVAHIY